MNAFNHQSRPGATFPGDYSRLQPRLPGTGAILRHLPSRPPAGGLVMAEGRLSGDERAAASNPNSTMAVALTARQFASPRAAPGVSDPANPVCKAPIGARP